MNGQAVHSREAGVGLGGHIPLGATGPVCHAGHRGCAEAMLTSGSIAAQVSAALQRPVDYDEVLRLAAAGDPAATTVVDEAAAALGRLVAMAANLTLQPAAVLAGEGIGLFSLAEDRVRAAIAARPGPARRARQALRRRLRLLRLGPGRGDDRDPGRRRPHRPRPGGAGAAAHPRTVRGALA